MYLSCSMNTEFIESVTKFSETMVFTFFLKRNANVATLFLAIIIQNGTGNLSAFIHKTTVGLQKTVT